MSRCNSSLSRTASEPSCKRPNLMSVIIPRPPTRPDVRCIDTTELKLSCYGREVAPWFQAVVERDSQMCINPCPSHVRSAPPWICSLTGRPIVAPSPRSTSPLPRGCHVPGLFYISRLCRKAKRSLYGQALRRACLLRA